MEHLQAQSCIRYLAPSHGNTQNLSAILSAAAYMIGMHLNMYTQPHYYWHIRYYLFIIIAVVKVRLLLCLPGAQVPAAP
jgi:hypothetical protein